MKSNEQLLSYVKRFFGFGDQPDRITILVPRVNCKRDPKPDDPVPLKCKNYPLYPYEVSPDDVITAIRVYSLLVSLYGEKVHVRFSGDKPEKTDGHLVLIGSPVTNDLSANVLEGRPFHFGEGHKDHHIIKKIGVEEECYSVEFNGNNETQMEERSITHDYSLISKFTKENTVEIVLAGCRAYGQQLFWTILRDPLFYKEALKKVEGKKEYQILLNVPVNKKVLGNSKIEDVYISDEIPSGTITWLHLSDLHFRAKSKNEGNKFIESLLKDITKCIDMYSLSPDFIAITGDLSFSGETDDYGNAKKFLDDLLDKTGLKNKDRLFIVPGNHDVQKNGSRLQNYFGFINEYLGRDFVKNKHFYVKHLTISGKKIAIIGLNSALESKGSKTDKYQISIDKKQVSNALEQAKGNDILRIALMHHPFDWLKPSNRDECEDLLTSDCRFVLNGHIHKTRISEQSAPDKRTGIIVAGTSYPKKARMNTYNFVQLQSDTLTGKIIIRRYSDNAHGFWAPDTLTYENTDCGTHVI